MGIAEIQAALAINKPAANPFAAQAAFTPPTQPAQPTPSPFGAPTAVANPFGGPAPTAVFQAPSAPAPLPVPVPVQQPFAFNPPPGFNPASTPPINPPGERASLNSPTPEPAAPSAAAPAVEAPAEPKRRGRKPKAEAAPVQAMSVQELGELHATVNAMNAEQATVDAGQALASPAEIVLSSISTEDLVALLRSRGYSAVLLESKA